MVEAAQLTAASAADSDMVQCGRSATAAGWWEKESCRFQDSAVAVQAPEEFVYHLLIRYR
jgi:hypothetical protein